MAEYINRQAVLDLLWKDGRITTSGIKAIPAADVAPVLHGRWGYSSDRPDTIICSCCDRAFDVWKHESKDFFYCPHCGAKMDKEADDAK